MDTVKIERGSCKMVAHRGVSGLERENTCAAFVAAGVKTYYGIECDVHVTKDGKFVICHDDNAKRVTGVDLPIEGSNLDEILALPILDTDGVTYRSDLRFCVLSDYIKICKKYGKRAVLELKNRIEKHHIKGIVDEIKGLDYLDGTTFITFDKRNVVDLRAIEGDAAIQFLSWEISDEVLEFAKEQGTGVDVGYKSVTKEMVDKAHALGMEVNVWTVNTPEDAAAVIAAGVDMITTNILE